MNHYYPYSHLGCLVIIATLLCFNPIAAVGENQDQSRQKESQEIENSRMDNLKNDYGKGFHEILNFFESMNKTVTALGTKFEDVQKEIASLKGKSNNCISGPHVETHGESSSISPNTTKDILTNPHAMLFTGINRTGTSEFYDFKTPTFKGGCYDVENNGTVIKSVDTMGKCVRLFSKSRCQGRSQAFYPGSATELNWKLQGIFSVGPCVDNEFELATIVNASSPAVEVRKVEPSNVLYKNSVPDVVETQGGYLGGFVESIKHSPIQSYVLGHGNRIQLLYGQFSNRHIRTPLQVESSRIAGQNQSFYSRFPIDNNNTTDEFGFAFPLELNGPADEIYNVFPQNRLQVEKYRRTFVPLFRQFLTANTNGHVDFRLGFNYDNSTSMRPSWIWYWYNLYDQSHDDIHYGYFPN